MKNSYPTEPVKSDPNDLMMLNGTTVGMLKNIVDQNGVQLDLTLKPDGIRVTVIKKFPDKSVKKSSVDIDNGNYIMLQNKIMSILAEVQMKFTM
jgi:hypothetical protein